MAAADAVGWGGIRGDSIGGGSVAEQFEPVEQVGVVVDGGELEVQAAQGFEGMLGDFAHEGAGHISAVEDAATGGAVRVHGAV